MILKKKVKVKVDLLHIVILAVIPQKVQITVIQAHSPVILQNQNIHIHMVNPAHILLHHILIQEVKKGGKKLIL
jgi:hypothetical protein